MLTSTNVDKPVVCVGGRSRRRAVIDESTGHGEHTGTPPAESGPRLIGRWTDLGSVIRQTRLARGLSQHRLAEEAGVSRAWLAHVESGHRKAEFELLLRTLDALGLSFSVGPTPTSDVGDPELDEALRLAGLQ